MRHLRNLLDLSAAEMRELFALAKTLKKQTAPKRGGARQAAAPRRTGQQRFPLSGRVMAMLFEKPSLRTRVSFEAAMAQLGGTTIFLLGSEVGLGQRERVADFARTLSRYTDLLVARTFSQAVLEELADCATIPVINGLSDDYHPCQALADLFTMQEVFGRLKGRKLAFVGDGNNVARTLAIGCQALGVSFTLAAPKKYQFDDRFATLFAGRFRGAALQQTADLREAVAGADVVYTDVWVSMGQEDEGDARRRALAGFQVDAAAMRAAGTQAKFMHCLPAHLGEEVTPEVIDGPQSIVFDQAENRLHVQKALILWLLKVNGRL